MASAVGVALPLIGREFAATAAQLAWISTAYLLAAATCVVPFGRLADVRGRKRVFVAGVALFTGASWLCALAPSIAALVAARVLQGVGAAMIFGTGVAILTSVFAPGQRGRALGFNVAAVYLGLSLGPFIGGWLCEAWGWRAVFGLNVPLGALIVAVALWRLKGEWAEARGESLDVVGAGVYTLTLVALLYGLTMLPARSGLGLVLLGVVGLVVFVRWELAATGPMLDVRLFRTNTVFALSSLAALINYSATAGVGFLLSLHLQYVMALTPGQAGLVLVAQPVTMTLVSPFAGWLSDRVEPRVVASAGMALTAAGLGVLAVLRETATVAFIVTSLALLGLGFGLFSSPNTNAVMSAVTPRQYGLASGFVGTMRLTGQVLSMGIVMLVFAVHLGSGRIDAVAAPVLVRSFRTAFTIFAVTCAVGIVASLGRGRLRAASPSSPP